MSKSNIDNLLKDLRACEDACKWAHRKPFKEILETCHRGDWLLWLYARTNPDDKRLITLVKGYCAQTVIHLMSDERSRKAVEVAIKYGLGEASDEELADATDAARAAAVYGAAALAAVYAADAAVYATAVDAVDTAAAAADYATAATAYAADAAARASRAVGAAYAAARKQNQLVTADICRKYFVNWNI